jgi:hypothetical protein
MRKTCVTSVAGHRGMEVAASIPTDFKRAENSIYGGLSRAAIHASAR